MKLLFIYPNANNSRKTRLSIIYNKLLFFEPPCFGILCALTPEKYHVDLIDERIKDIDFNSQYDLVGITVYTNTAKRAYQIADEFRKRNIKVVLGGWHVTALPNEAKKHADSVVIGEAEETWPLLLKDLEKNELKPFYEQTSIVNPKIIPKSRRLAKNKFSLEAYVQATRGCPNRCEFCSLTNRKYGKIYRTRPVENVIEEIKSLPHKYLFFNDDSLTINPIYTKKLFREMKDLNKIFYCNGNLNILNKDEEFLQLAQEAGCKIWMLGLESVSQKTINFLGKKTNKVKEYISTIKKIHDHGMIVQGNFIFGFDTDHKDIFKRTIDFTNSCEIDIPEFMVLTPFPGTPLYNRLEKSDRIFTKEWDKYNLRSVVFKPKNMSASMLENETLRAQKIFSSSVNILKRTVKSLKYGPYQTVLNASLNLQVKNEFS